MNRHVRWQTARELTGAEVQMGDLPGSVQVGTMAAASLQPPTLHVQARQAVWLVTVRVVKRDQTVEATP